MFPCPLAQPFHPSAASSLEFAIFNDGVPSSVFYGMHPEHELVASIPDEAIEELFPPSAEDAAELEAADDFVETMAWLSYLDEREEAARFDHAGRGRRWAARRREGLVDKPRPPRSHHAEGGRPRSGTLGSAGSLTSEEALVPYVPRAFEVRPRKAEGRIYGGGVPRNVRGAMHGRSRGPIQQPRKHY